MQQPADHPSAPSFAGMLAALAAPGRKSAPAWDDSLPDDVVTLSYERALRAHARYRGAARDDCALTDLPDPEPPCAAASPQPAAPPRVAPERTAAAAAPVPAKQRKNASITIRLSAQECAQLRQRAAEAGLTISAYLRSCTLEAEALRALVKSTLAQMHAATQPQATSVPKPAPPAGPRRSWLRNLLPQRPSAARG